MRFKFNGSVLVAITLLGLLSAKAWAEALPLIVPEATFRTLPRITGNTLNQRLLDLHSTIGIQLTDPTERFKPDTPIVVLRQGLRLNTPDGRKLGVLAVPIARGHTLSQQTEADEIANPNQPGVAWIRLQSLHQEVMRGDSVITQSQAQAYQPPACKAPTDSDTSALASQVIALVSQADMLSSGGELLIISGGCSAGLTQGGLVTLWRSALTTYGRKLDQPIENARHDGSSVFDDNPAITRAQTPGHRIGTATVAAVYPDAAIIRIRNITQAAQPGDLVRISPAKTSP